MNIIVCMKQVAYPDTPASAYSVDNTTKRIVLPEDTPLVINPFDENAIEAGLQLKDATGGKLTVISLAVRPAEKVIRDLKQALAMGADEAVLLDDPSFAGGDSFSTAYVLAAAIQKIGEYDLVLCGLQAADGDAGQVGPGIAELLGIPSATSVTRIAPGAGVVRVRRIIENGHDILELPLPSLLAIASDETLMPRIAPLPGIIKAKKRQIPVWSASDINADVSMTGSAGAKTNVMNLSIPRIEGTCEFIRPDNPEEAAVMLAERLRQEKII